MFWFFWGKFCLFHCKLVKKTLNSVQFYIATEEDFDTANGDMMLSCNLAHHTLSTPHLAYYSGHCAVVGEITGSSLYIYHTTSAPVTST